MIYESVPRFTFYFHVFNLFISITHLPKRFHSRRRRSLSFLHPRPCSIYFNDWRMWASRKFFSKSRWSCSRRNWKLSCRGIYRLRCSLLSPVRHLRNFSNCLRSGRSVVNWVIFHFYRLLASLSLPCYLLPFHKTKHQVQTTAYE